MLKQIFAIQVLLGN